jgi:diacylglycerol kinase family enzyme
VKITLIHNPDAGSDNQPDADKILEFIQRAGHTVLWQSSKEIGWDRVLKEAADFVAVAGGDGIVGQVAKRLIGKHVPIAVLPLGTANNVATVLGLTHFPLNELIEGWSNARRVKFDIGVASGPWGWTTFLEGLGVGLFTETMSRLDAAGNIQLVHLNETAERITSVLEMLRSRLRGCPANWLKVLLDDRDLSGDYILLEAMNIHCIGPNLCLAPAADPGDGLLDIVIASSEDRGRIDRYLTERIEGKASYPGLTVHKGKHLSIEYAGLTTHIDDDLWPKQGAIFPHSSITIDVALSTDSLEMLAPA